MSRKPIKHPPTILDVEASGFGKGSYPIEVGVAMGTGERYCRLIRPQASWQHWDDEAEKLHGISRTLLDEKGVPAAQVCAELNELLAKKVVYSDGWAVDKPWLIKLFADAGRQMQFVLSPLEMILKEPQMDIWDATKKQIQASSNLTRHRASSDAELIQVTYVRTQEQLNPPSL